MHSHIIRYKRLSEVWLRLPAVPDASIELVTCGCKSCMWPGPCSGSWSTLRRDPLTPDEAVLLPAFVNSETRGHKV